MQPWKPVDTIRDSIFPLFYPNSSAESGEKSAVISSNFTSAPDTMHRYYLQHPFISDRDGEISMQSIDLTKEMAIEIKQRLLCRSVPEPLLIRNKPHQPSNPIRSLDFKGCKLTRTLLEILLEGIKECRGLECLNLADNHLLQNDVDVIIDWFTQSPASCRHINKLSFSGSFKFSPKSICDLLLAISDHCSALKILQLNSCGLCDEHIESFRKFLSIISRSNTPLHELYLNNNDITTRGCRQLLDARDTFLPQLKILAYDNLASESLISRLSCPFGHVHGSPSITDPYTASGLSEIQIEDQVSTCTNDISSYVEQTDHVFQGELRSGLLSFIKQTFGDDSPELLDKKTTTELCMHCISAIQLHVNKCSTTGLSKEIEELMRLKDMLKRSNIPCDELPLTIESPAAEALSVAIHLIQSLLQITTGQIALE